jgi:hypothetical protein
MFKTKYCIVDFCLFVYLCNVLKQCLKQNIAFVMFEYLFVCLFVCLSVCKREWVVIMYVLNDKQYNYDQKNCDAAKVAMKTGTRFPWSELSGQCVCGRGDSPLSHAYQCSICTTMAHMPVY